MVGGSSPLPKGHDGRATSARGTFLISVLFWGRLTAAVHRALLQERESRQEITKCTFPWTRPVSRVPTFMQSPLQTLPGTETGSGHMPASSREQDSEERSPPHVFQTEVKQDCTRGRTVQKTGQCLKTHDEDIKCKTLSGGFLGHQQTVGHQVFDTRTPLVSTVPSCEKQSLLSLDVPKRKRPQA